MSDTIPTSERALTRWIRKQSLGKNFQFFKYVRAIHSRTDVPTLRINLNTGELQYNPTFLRDHVKTDLDMLFLFLHERNHIVIRQVYSEIEDEILRTFPRPIQHILLDCYNNVVTRISSYARSSLPERYYDDESLHVLLKNSPENTMTYLAAQTKDKDAAYHLAEFMKQSYLDIKRIPDYRRFFQTFSAWWVTLSKSVQDKLSDDMDNTILLGSPHPQYDTSHKNPSNDPSKSTSSNDTSNCEHSLIGHNIRRVDLGDIIPLTPLSMLINDTWDETMDKVAPPQQNSFYLGGTYVHLNTAALARSVQGLRQTTVIGSVESVDDEQDVVVPADLSPTDFYKLATGMPIAYFDVPKFVDLESQKPIAVYVDISSSMTPFYRFMCHILAQITDAHTQIYHFSTVVNEAKAGDRYGYTTGGTSFFRVAEHIRANPTPQGIVFLSDMEGSLAVDICHELFNHIPLHILWCVSQHLLRPYDQHNCPTTKDEILRVMTEAPRPRLLAMELIQTARTVNLVVM